MKGTSGLEMSGRTVACRGLQSGVIAAGPDFGGQQVELRAAAARGVVLRVVGADPDARSPACAAFLRGPWRAPGGLVGGKKRVRLLDGGCLARVTGRWPDGRGCAGHGRLRLRRNAVPVMHGNRPASGPTDVLRFPVGVPDDQWLAELAEACAGLAGSLVKPWRAGDCIQVPAKVIRHWPEGRSAVIPADPGWRGMQHEPPGRPGCEPDSASLTTWRPGTQTYPLAYRPCGSASPPRSSSEFVRKAGCRTRVSPICQRMNHQHSL